MLRLSEHAARRPKFWFTVSGLAAMTLLALTAAPTLLPDRLPFLHPLHVDTDPENMLPEEEPVRQFHAEMRRMFDLHDMIVVGVVNETSATGVFNPRSLADIHSLTEHAKGLVWEKDGQRRGVIAADIIAPSTVDTVRQAGLGAVAFDWLMPEPPATAEEALAVAERARRIPLLDGTLLSRDGQALALYIPITAKEDSYRVANGLREKIAGFQGGDTYYITGLPIAQDQFGVEMFIQMAIAAPLAMLLIFLLMWWFFRNVRLIAAPMIVAMLSVIITMGLLVATGNTVHIMSSMIPIFVMPIAVLDSVHVLSDFFDRYPGSRDRRAVLKDVMRALWKPMLYTSLTTCAGFASLMFTPIPPVQVFGLFVAIGVVVAWLLTVTLVPAYIMLMPEKALDGFGAARMQDAAAASATPLARLLQAAGRFSFRRARLVLVAVLGLGALSWYGIERLVINDNPVKWFGENHEIRVADRALNARFGGAYMAYLALSPAGETTAAALRSELSAAFAPLPAGVARALEDRMGAETAENPAAFLDNLWNYAADAAYDAPSPAEQAAWEQAQELITAARDNIALFRDPAVLRYIAALQQHLQDSGLVGKSNALPDIVKTIHRELYLGDAAAYRIPDSSAAVSQTLLAYQSSHRPQDLWHFVTPEADHANIWFQLTSGDNRDMIAVTEAVDRFMADNPPPQALQHRWFGLTYINSVWQDKMVTGMASSFLGSFLVVLLMTSLLFRSFRWGLLAMVPLTATIGLIYGLIGLAGKDYDMPVAVLSSLSLGLAVDYAIHFLARSRELRTRYNSWAETLPAAFGEPARAIARNIIVIGVGFLPLLAAPLTPYNTVGLLISAIMVIAGAASLLVLPALLTLFEPYLFRKAAK